MIQKLQASLYATRKRLQGYHLLKNPKGTPPTEVNMVKESYFYTTDYDDVFDTERIKRTFSKNGNKTEIRLFTSRHFFDADKMKMTSRRKKNKFYLVSEDGVDKKPAVKEAVTDDELKTRRHPHKSKKIDKEKLKAQNNRGYYKKRYPLGLKVISFGLHKRIGPPPEDRPNFFKVLYQNLTNKG